MRKFLSARVGGEVPAIARGVCWKIPLRGHDETTYPTRQEAQDEIDKLVATGLTRVEPTPISFA